MSSNTNIATIVKTFAAPADPATLIELKKKDLLGELDLDQLIRELNQSAELLRVAKHGVADYGNLPGKITAIMDGLVQGTMKAETTMWEFRDSSNSVLQSLALAMSLLIKAQEDGAIKLIAGCEKYANKMEKSAQDLADEFTRLANDTVKVTIEAQDARGKSLAEIEEMRKRANALVAESTLLQTQQGEYTKQSQQLDSMIQEAREDQAREEQSAMIGTIVGGLTSALSAGFSTYASMNNPGKWLSALTPTVTDNSQQKAAEKQKATLDEREKEAKQKADALADAQDTYETAQAETKKRRTAWDKAKEALAAAEKAADKDAKAKAESDVAAARKALDDAEATDAKAKKAADKAKSDDETARAAAQAAAETLRKLSEVADEATKAAKERLSEARSAKKQLYDLKFKIMEKQSDAAGKLAKYAVEMKQVNNDREVSEAAVKSLLQAISSLLQVAASLRMAAQFWRALGIACRSLGDARFKEYIEAIKGLDAKDRMEAYRDSVFVDQVIDYCGLWGALWAISNEYGAAARSTREKAIEYFKENPDRATAQKTLPELAARLERNAEQAQQMVMQRRDALAQAERIALEAGKEDAKEIVTA